VVFVFKKYRFSCLLNSLFYGTKLQDFQALVSNGGHTEAMTFVRLSDPHLHPPFRHFSPKTPVISASVFEFNCHFLQLKNMLHSYFLLKA